MARVPGIEAAALPIGADAPILTVAAEADAGRPRMPGFVTELIAFGACAIGVALLIPGPVATRTIGALTLVALALWRAWSRGRQFGLAGRTLPPLAFAVSLGTLASITGEPLYDVLLAFNVLLVAAQEDRRAVWTVIAGTWIALAVPAAIHAAGLGLRAAVWAVLVPLLAMPVQRRSQELRERVALGPKLRALQARMLAAHDSRETLIEAAPDLAGCAVVALVEPDSTGCWVVTATSRAEIAGASVPEDERSLVRRAASGAQPVFVPDSRTAAGLLPELTGELGGCRSWFCAPVTRSGVVAAVLCAGWAAVVDDPDDIRIDVVRSLASEASTTIDHTDLLRSLSDTASRDPLTGLVNRRGWDALLAKELAIGRSRGTPLSVAIADLDRFKDFNDVHGHRAGDRLLREAAGAWTAAVRKGDVLARWGGEEFTLLLPDCDAAEALDVVERLRAGTPGGQTCSAGVATWDGTETAVELFERMDEALYAAKASGRDVALPAPSTGRSGAPVGA